MSKRKRKQPKLLAETQELINQARPGVIALYRDINMRTLDSWMAGWLSWALNKRYKREDGTRYSSVSPHTREQIKCWVKAGRPYEWDGGLDEDAEEEHDRADRAQKRRTDPPLQKTRRRRRRTTA